MPCDETQQKDVQQTTENLSSAKSIDEAYDYSDEIIPSLSCTHCWDKHFSPLLEFLKIRLQNYFYPIDYAIEQGRDVILIEGILLGSNEIKILVECSGIVFNETYSRVTIAKTESGNYAINKLLEQYVIGKHKLPSDIYLIQDIAHIDSIIHNKEYHWLRNM